MTIRFTCECGRVLQANDEHAGRRTRCPACGRELDVPGADEAIQPAAPASSAVRERGPRQPRAEEEEVSRHRADEAPATSGKAVAALLLGLGSFCTWIVTGVPALILGFLSLKEINRSRGRLAGKGLALTGLLLAAFNSCLLCPAGFALGYWFYRSAGGVVADVRESAARQQSTNNLKEIGLALHNFHDTYRHLPSVAHRRPGLPPQFAQQHSWRVHLLPYIGEEVLFRQYRFEEPWDSPNNRQLLTRMPKIYAHPLADPATTAAGSTHYRCYSGPQTPLGDPNRAHGFTDMADGTSNTVLIVEAREAVPWLKPEGLPFTPNGPLPPLAEFFTRGPLVVMADGSVRMIRKDARPEALRAAITYKGGEVLPPDQELFSR